MHCLSVQHQSAKPRLAQELTRSSSNILTSVVSCLIRRASISEFSETQARLARNLHEDGYQPHRHTSLVVIGTLYSETLLRNECINDHSQLYKYTDSSSYVSICQYWPAMALMKAYKARALPAHFNIPCRTLSKIESRFSRLLKICNFINKSPRPEIRFLLVNFAF